MTRFTYAYGYKSRAIAEKRLEDCFADGEITAAERPEIYCYTGKGGRRYWAIEIDG